MYQIEDKKRIKANNAAYFKPQRVHISPLKLALGSMVTDGVTTSDHKGRVRTATFTTIGHYLAQFNLSQHAVVLYANGRTQAI